VKTITPAVVSASLDEMYAAMEYGEAPGVNGRATADEIRLRVGACRRMIEEGKTKSFIYQAFHAKLGLSSSTVKNYIELARRQIREDICRSEEELVGFAHYTLTKIMADAEAKNSDRIRATMAFMRLHGLEKPIKIAPTNPEGDKPYLADARSAVEHLTVEQLQALASAKSVLESTARVIDAKNV
jgi:hypothetical protein